MKEFSIIFENILQIIDLYKIKSVNEFAVKYLGYSAAEKINRLKDVNAKPSFDIIQDISNKFEDIDANWLITGKGQMLKKDREKVIYKNRLDGIDELMEMNLVLLREVKENHELKDELKALKREIAELKSGVKAPE